MIEFELSREKEMSEEKPQTIEQRENGKRKLLKKLVATARSIITFEIGLSVGARKLGQLVHWLEQDGIIVSLPVLDEYEAATRAIPSGKERLNCSRDALRRYDFSLNPINLQFHDRVLDACFELTEKFGDIENVLATSKD